MVNLERCGSCFHHLTSGSETCSVCGYKRNAESRNSMALPHGFLLSDQYWLGRVLGQGGFGITYAAWDEINNRKVAVKEYFPLDIAARANVCRVSPTDPEHQNLYEYGKGRFEDEANALARFNRHPGIVEVFDLFHENETVYLAMQFLEGKTWMELMEEKGGRLPLDEALAILIPALESIRAVHETGMLHRDLSPDNIFILPNRQVKLIDFGAARYAMREQQQVYSIIFKPGYTPEEQYRSSGKIGPWSDLYALIASFYHAITGKLPRDAMNRLEKDTVSPPSAAGVSLPREMEIAILKAMAVKSGERYQSVDEFKTALLESMNDEKILKRNKVPVWIWFISAAAFIDLAFIILLFFI